MSTFLWGMATGYCIGLIGGVFTISLFAASPRVSDREDVYGDVPKVPE